MTVSSSWTALNSAELVTWSSSSSRMPGGRVWSGLGIWWWTAIPAKQATTQQPLTNSSKDTINKLQVRLSNLSQDLNAFLVA